MNRPPNLCPYCKEDFQGKGYIYMMDHNCPEWQESLITKPITTYKELKKWFKRNWHDI